MTVGLANRLAALGMFAIHVAEQSGEAAVTLLEKGLKPPIGSGQPAEVFTACGIGAFEALVNADLMPDGVKMRITLQFSEVQEFRELAVWDNAAGNRRVVTVHDPKRNVYMSFCLRKGDQYRPPFYTHTEREAMDAHRRIVEAVLAGRI